MPFSRRAFLRGLSGGVVALPLVSGRGLEAAFAEPARRLAPPSNDLIRLDSNENPNGPSPRALEAIRAAFGEAGRYPHDFRDQLRSAVAKHHGVPDEQVLLGSGSTEHLRLAVDAFATPGSGVVTAAPSFENIANYAQARGVPVQAVPVGSDLGLDLDAMLDRSAGAGLVYVCNPNNPTGTVRGKRDVEAFVAQVLRRAPTATVLVDEAYFEYVEDESYGTLIPLAREDPRVLVLRTFSKIHGMAGLRVGYAIGRAEPIAAMHAFGLPHGVNVLAGAAALASLADPGHLERERDRNREVRAFTERFFEKAGCPVTRSSTNFVLVGIGRPIVDFRAACEKRGVAIGRPFPPLDQHARISFGTMDEMRRATAVFAELLRI